MARCIRGKGIELSPEGRAALDALADDFSTWRANPTRRGTPLPSETPTPVAVGPTGSWSPSGGSGHLRRSVMPQPTSPLRSEVEGRDMAHQVMVEPSEGAKLLLSLVRADGSRASLLLGTTEAERIGQLGQQSRLRTCCAPRPQS